MNNTTAKHLFDIRHACEQIMRYAGGMSYEEFVSSEATVLVVERLLITIGEAVNRLRVASPAGAAELRSDLRAIVAVRNRMVHNYDDIDHAVIYVIITKHVPALLDEVRRMMTGDAPEVSDE